MQTIPRLWMLFCAILVSCKYGQPKPAVDAPLFADELPAIPANIQPIMGHRLVVRGDFDGDSKQDTLKERFISRKTGQELAKSYDSLAYYEQLIALTEQALPQTFLQATQPHIATFDIASNLQQFGLYFLKNEGDLNGDGTDELSFVMEWADWSSTNTYSIATYHKGKWQVLYEFPIWEWQLPSPSELENTQPDSLAQAYRPLVAPIQANKIKVIFRNKESMEDSTIVKLKRLR